MNTMKGIPAEFAIVLINRSRYFEIRFKKTRISLAV